MGHRGPQPLWNRYATLFHTILSRTPLSLSPYFSFIKSTFQRINRSLGTTLGVLPSPSGAVRKDRELTTRDFHASSRSGNLRRSSMCNVSSSSLAEEVGEWRYIYNEKMA